VDTLLTGGTALALFWQRLADGLNPPR
jgi:hypothetical protein